MTQHRTIAVVGGGFSGVMTAVHLLRGARPGLHVALINRSGPTARGVAYGTRSERHLLNVPAGRMSAFPEDEEHFLRFAQPALPGTVGGSFVPRRLYGEYLDALLAEAVAGRPPGVWFSHHVAGARRLVSEAGGGAMLELDDGAVVRADRVVLAMGNFAPANPDVADAAFFADGRGYVRDPWAPGALDAVDPARPVVLIGTGLTMVDVALALEGRGVPQMLAISRRGLLPHAHRSPALPPPPPTLPGELLEGPPTARAYLRALRRQVRAQGSDWRETVGAIRHVTPRLWERLPLPERRRFLRHLLPHWDVHRHRVAPEPAAALEALRREGRLVVRAGRLARVARAGDGVELRFRPRGGRAEESVRVGTVVNCTGPCARVDRLDDPFVRDLVERGVLTPDPLGIGVETDGYALRGAGGRPSRSLFYTGPFLRASLWEATAVPELRTHARQAAEAVLASLTDAGAEAAD